MSIPVYQRNSQFHVSETSAKKIYYLTEKNKEIQVKSARKLNVS